MKKFKLLNLLIIIILTPIFITSCKPNLKGGDRAMHDPKKRVEKNIQEGRGMRLFGGDDKKGGTFDFASSKELWRASLDLSLIHI